ncbi:MAG: L,D-transpeptidase [Hyphomicrobiaceae bacterium]
MTHVRARFTAFAAMAMLGLAAPATAQDGGFFSLWDWGGGSIVGGSGREVVSFPASHQPGQIIVSFTDKRLYHIVGRGQAVSYPIATPRQQSRWQGVMSVSQKRVNPSWTPTPAMRKENPRLPAFVPGGHPQNPLGVRALYLGSSMYRIHGTDAPWTIGQPVSKGCIRMYNQDVVDLYNRVRVGTRVTVTWQSYAGVSYASSSSSWGSDSAERPRRKWSRAALR